MKALALFALLWAPGALAGDGEEGSCPAGGCEAGGGQHEEYIYPRGRGHPRHFGQSPYSFGGKECNLSASLKWSWTHPKGRYNHVIVGKPILDDQANIYIASGEGMYKFSIDGEMKWSWMLPGGSTEPRNIPNHPTIMDGLVYNCITTGEVFALSMETGELKWMVKASHSIGSDTAFTVAINGMVLLDIDHQTPPHVHNRLAALNGTTGELIWAYHPDTGVWNYLPLFPGDDTFLFQAWTGAAFRMNLSTGEKIWRAGKPPGDLSWSDGGPALGPNGVFYTVSSESPQNKAPMSKGGGLHAFSVEDGTLLWEQKFDQGIYTYPVVGRAGKDSALSVVTGVGSLGSFPLIAPIRMFLIPAAVLGLLLGVLASFCICCCCGTFDSKCRRRTGRYACAGLLIVPGCMIILSTVLMPHGYNTTVQAFDANTGNLQWKVDLPFWPWYSASGDAEGFMIRHGLGIRKLCLPCASSYGTMDAQGAFYMGHLDGKLYRIKDWDGNGRIEGESELCAFDAGSAFMTGGPTIAPGGRLLASSCDSLYVFEVA